MANFIASQSASILLTQPGVLYRLKVQLLDFGVHSGQVDFEIHPLRAAFAFKQTPGSDQKYFFTLTDLSRENAIILGDFIDRLGVYHSTLVSIPSVYPEGQLVNKNACGIH